MLSQPCLWPDVNPTPLVPPPITPFINTFCNRRVNPLDFKASDVSIIDIGHALALCNRFAGHTRKPISVAQHSVWVSRLCEGTGYEMQALLHDASEAYTGDVTKWLKAAPAMKGFRDAEQRIQDTILRVFNQETELAPVVTWADKRMVCWEAEQGIEGFFNYAMPPGYTPVPKSERFVFEDWKFITWQEAEEQFRARFSMLLVTGN
jgi:hypothetical protein